MNIEEINKNLERNDHNENDVDGKKNSEQDIDIVQVAKVNE